MEEELPVDSVSVLSVCSVCSCNASVRNVSVSSSYGSSGTFKRWEYKEGEGSCGTGGDGLRVVLSVTVGIFDMSLP